MSNTPKIDELLNKYELTENGLPAIGDLRTTKERFKKAIYDLMVEVIGEETLQTIEYKTVYGTPKKGKRKKAGWKVRDSLRQEQRQKLSDLFNITQ